MKRITRMLAGCSLALAVTGFTAAPVLAKDKPDHAKQHEKKDHREAQHHGQGRMMRVLFKDITLTDQQKDQVKTIIHDQRQQARAWYKEHAQEIRKLRQEMREARKNKDKEAVKSARDKMRQLRESAPGMKDVSDKISEDVLTQDQRPQFEKNIKEMKEAMKDRRAKHKDKHHRKNKSDKHDNDDEG